MLEAAVPTMLTGSHAGVGICDLQCPRWSDRPGEGTRQRKADVTVLGDGDKRWGLCHSSLYRFTSLTFFTIKRFKGRQRPCARVCQESHCGLW